MIKKIIMAAMALCLVFSMSACGVAPESLPTLTMENTSSNTGSEVSGEEVSQEPREEVADTGFEDTLNGLCQYMEANYGVTGDKAEMSFKEIGAIGGFRYKFIYNGGTVQAEFYEYDPANLDEKGQECIDSVKENGIIKVLENEVPATLSDNGKYLMIYTDDTAEKKEPNRIQMEKVHELFVSFKK